MNHMPQQCTSRLGPHLLPILKSLSLTSTPSVGCLSHGPPNQMRTIKWTLTAQHSSLPFMYQNQTVCIGPHITDFIRRQHCYTLATSSQHDVSCPQFVSFFSSFFLSSVCCFFHCIIGWYSCACGSDIFQTKGSEFVFFVCFWHPTIGMHLPFPFNAEHIYAHRRNHFSIADEGRNNSILHPERLEFTL